MTEAVINNLPELLRKHLCTLKKASMDTTNRQAMCESKIMVVNFDKIPNEYASGRGWSGVPKSNDALYIDTKNKWFFVEFKNGTVKKDEIYRKIYDSLIMLVELGLIPNLDFARNNINYILVYNEEKTSKCPPSESRDITYGYFGKLAQTEKRLFDIDKFEKYLFHETHTYTKELFQEKFIDQKEKEECINKK